MADFPHIQTAIPHRRYHYGDYSVTVLGDVQSGDDRDYVYVAAFVREGEAQPRLFVTAERTQGGTALRVVNATMDEILDVDPRWAKLEDLCEQALQTGAQLLGLEKETPYLLG